MIDVEKRIIAYDAGMHMDLEQLLLEQGSKQTNLWGVNLYQNVTDSNWVEFDSMINIKPKDNNRSRGVEDIKIRNTILEIIKHLIL